MSDNNGWPGEPGVPLNPERDGWHWVGGIPYWWRVFDDDDAPQWQAHHLYFTAEEWSYRKYGGPVLTPAEVNARVKQARRDALEEAALELKERSAFWAQGTNHEALIRADECQKIADILDALAKGEGDE